MEEEGNTYFLSLRRNVVFDNTVYAEFNVGKTGKFEDKRVLAFNQRGNVWVADQNEFKAAFSSNDTEARAAALFLSRASSVISSVSNKILKRLSKLQLSRLELSANEGFSNPLTSTGLVIVVLSSALLFIWPDFLNFDFVGYVLEKVFSKELLLPLFVFSGAVSIGSKEKGALRNREKETYEYNLRWIRGRFDEEDVNRLFTGDNVIFKLNLFISSYKTFVSLLEITPKEEELLTDDLYNTSYSCALSGINPSEIKQTVDIYFNEMEIENMKQLPFELKKELLRASSAVLKKERIYALRKTVEYYRSKIGGLEGDRELIKQWLKEVSHIASNAKHELLKETMELYSYEIGSLKIDREIKRQWVIAASHSAFSAKTVESLKKTIEYYKEVIGDLSENRDLIEQWLKSTYQISNRNVHELLKEVLSRSSFNASTTESKIDFLKSSASAAVFVARINKKAKEIKPSPFLVFTLKKRWKNLYWPSLGMENFVSKLQHLFESKEDMIEQLKEEASRGWEYESRALRNICFKSKDDYLKTEAFRALVYAAAKGSEYAGRDLKEVMGAFSIADPIFQSGMRYMSLMVRMGSGPTVRFMIEFIFASGDNYKRREVAGALANARVRFSAENLKDIFIDLKDSQEDIRIGRIIIRTLGKLAMEESQVEEKRLQELIDEISGDLREDELIELKESMPGADNSHAAENLKNIILILDNNSLQGNAIVELERAFLQGNPAAAEAIDELVFEFKTIFHKTNCLFSKKAIISALLNAALQERPAAGKVLSEIFTDLKDTEEAYNLRMDVFDALKVEDISEREFTISLKEELMPGLAETIKKSNNERLRVRAGRALINESNHGSQTAAGLIEENWDIPHWLIDFKTIRNTSSPQYLNEAKRILKDMRSIEDLLTDPQRDIELKKYLLAVLFIINNSYLFLNKEEYNKLSSDIMENAGFEENPEVPVSTFQISVPTVKNFKSRELLAGLLAKKTAGEIQFDSYRPAINEFITNLSWFALLEEMGWEEWVEESLKENDYRRYAKEREPFFNMSGEPNEVASAQMHWMIKGMKNANYTVVWTDLFKSAINVVQETASLEFGDFIEALLLRYKRYIYPDKYGSKEKAEENHIIKTTPQSPGRIRDILISPVFKKHKAAVSPIQTLKPDVDEDEYLLVQSYLERKINIEQLEENFKEFIKQYGYTPFSDLYIIAEENLGKKETYSIFEDLISLKKSAGEVYSPEDWKNIISTIEYIFKADEPGKIINLLLKKAPNTIKKANIDYIEFILFARSVVGREGYLAFEVMQGVLKGIEKGIMKADELIREKENIFSFIRFNRFFNPELFYLYRLKGEENLKDVSWREVDLSLFQMALFGSDPHSLENLISGHINIRPARPPYRQEFLGPQLLALLEQYEITEEEDILRISRTPRSESEIKSLVEFLAHQGITKKEHIFSILETPFDKSEIIERLLKLKEFGLSDINEIADILSEALTEDQINSLYDIREYILSGRKKDFYFTDFSDHLVKIFALSGPKEGKKLIDQIRNLDFNRIYEGISQMPEDAGKEEFINRYGRLSEVILKYFRRDFDSLKSLIRGYKKEYRYIKSGFGIYREPEEIERLIAFLNENNIFKGSEIALILRTPYKPAEIEGFIKNLKELGFTTPFIIDSILGTPNLKEKINSLFELKEYIEKENKYDFSEHFISYIIKKLFPLDNEKRWEMAKKIVELDFDRIYIDITQMPANTTKEQLIAKYTDMYYFILKFFGYARFGSLRAWLIGDPHSISKDPKVLEEILGETDDIQHTIDQKELRRMLSNLTARLSPEKQKALEMLLAGYPEGTNGEQGPETVAAAFPGLSIRDVKDEFADMIDSDLELQGIISDVFPSVFALDEKKGKPYSLLYNLAELIISASAFVVLFEITVLPLFFSLTAGFMAFAYGLMLLSAITVRFLAPETFSIDESLKTSVNEIMAEKGADMYLDTQRKTGPLKWHRHSETKGKDVTFKSFLFASSESKLFNFLRRIELARLITHEIFWLRGSGFIRVFFAEPFSFAGVLKIYDELRNLQKIEDKNLFKAPEEKIRSAGINFVKNFENSAPIEPTPDYTLYYLGENPKEISPASVQGKSALLDGLIYHQVEEEQLGVALLKENEIVASRDFYSCVGFAIKGTDGNTGKTFIALIHANPGYDNELPIIQSAAAIKKLREIYNAEDIHVFAHGYSDSFGLNNKLSADLLAKKLNVSNVNYNLKTRYDKRSAMAVSSKGVAVITYENQKPSTITGDYIYIWEENAVKPETPMEISGIKSGMPHKYLNALQKSLLEGNHSLSEQEFNAAMEALEKTNLKEIAEKSKGYELPYHIINLIKFLTAIAQAGAIEEGKLKAALAYEIGEDFYFSYLIHMDYDHKEILGLMIELHIRRSIIDYKGPAVLKSLAESSLRRDVLNNLLNQYSPKPREQDIIRKHVNNYRSILGEYRIIPAGPEGMAAVEGDIKLIKTEVGFIGTIITALSDMISVMMPYYIIGGGRRQTFRGFVIRALFGRERSISSFDMNALVSLHSAM
ncbi:MAG: hypothetical protein ACQESB_04035 [Elusimicrobiota bacterium]